MRHSLKVGFSFGLTSAVITTLGLMVGLYASLGTRLAVIGGILTIAIADAFSDALGIHMSEESEGVHTQKQIWESTISTFLTKFIFALTFLIPVLLLNLKTAIIVSAIYGLVLIGYFSYHLAVEQHRRNKTKIILEHLTIAILVILITYLVGIWTASVFI